PFSPENIRPCACPVSHPGRRDRDVLFAVFPALFQLELSTARHSGECCRSPPLLAWLRRGDCTNASRCALRRNAVPFHRRRNRPAARDHSHHLDSDSCDTERVCHYGSCSPDRGRSLSLSWETVGTIRLKMSEPGSSLYA